LVFPSSAAQGAAKKNLSQETKAIGATR
jgi:hypothetical protein